jgi:hypothetical protein
MAPDIFLHADLPFPKSLPQFQRLFPEDAACATYLERIRWEHGGDGGHPGSTGCLVEGCDCIAFETDQEADDE